MTQEEQHNLETIILRGKPSDPLVIEALVKEYYAYLLRLSISILQNRQEAEDATQEAIITAVANLHKFRKEASLKTWLYTITLNTCRGHLRKQKTRQTLQNTLQSLHLTKSHTIPSPENSSLHNESAHELWSAVDSLSEKHRLPVILRYVHELQIAEIAQILNLSEGTVHSRLHFARKKLKTIITLKDIQSADWSKSND